jgi:signal transduction histidine kinase/ActR/RegA family two-component response regulator
LHGVPLRRRLILLTAAAILPLTLVAFVSLYVLRRQQAAQAEQVGIELARSVANAVDSELGSVVAVLEALATTPAIDVADLEGFRERAVRIIGGKHDWEAIVLADRNGRILVDTRFRETTPTQAPPTDKETLARVVATRAPVIGNLTRIQNEWMFVVRVPVVRSGVVGHTVEALIRPDLIRNVLVRQRVPDDWVISIIDNGRRRVARSKAHEENLGGPLTETGRRLVESGQEGAGVSISLEGERVFTPYSRLPKTGWIAALGIPTAIVDAAIFRSVAFFGGGVLLSIAVGVACALLVARSITRPIANLRGAAESLGRKETPQPGETPIQEIREVGVALKTAAAALTRAEAEREELLQKERHARERAEAADRAKDEFMAVLSHELRTPLNAVFGWARWLQSGQLNDQAMVQRATNAIARNAHAQVQLVDDLLDLARITSGKMRLDVGMIDLRNVLNGALEAVRPAADAKSIAIDADAGEEPCLVVGDSARLQQVVWNVLMNAVKFTPNGGNVRLELQRASGNVQLSVSDTGQGIAPHVLPHIFERFRQGDSSSTRSHGGLGLGLALVKHLVELHGGAVTAQSPGEGLGTIVTVTLPIAATATVAAVASRTQGQIAAAKGAPEPERLEGVRVLVTDDDTDALVLISTILAESGADVRTCTSAGDALDELRGWRPDVLVSDIGMPGEDGYSLIAKIRALDADEGGGTPAIALSAYGRPHDRMRAVAAGFTMHVPKPVDPGELTAIVADLAGVVEPPAPQHDASQV